MLHLSWFALSGEVGVDGTNYLLLARGRFSAGTGSCFNKHDLTVVFKVVTVFVLSGRSGVLICAVITTVDLTMPSRRPPGHCPNTELRG